VISDDFQFLYSLSDCSQFCSSFELGAWCVFGDDDKVISEGFTSNFNACNHETNVYS
jgi:hypothetical protein